MTKLSVEQVREGDVVTVAHRDGSLSRFTVEQVVDAKAIGKVLLRSGSVVTYVDYGTEVGVDAGGEVHPRASRR